MNSIGLADNVMKILESSCATSTWNNYNSVIKKWEIFCNINRISYTSPNVNNVLTFLAKLYEDGLSYSSINTARSALSTMLGNLDGVKLGEHFLVKRFLKGIYKLRPPTSKYNVTWDASLVLQLFEQWPNNSELTFAQLSRKLVALLALCSGQRVQAITAIRLDNIVWGNPVQIIISSLLKTTRPGHSNPILVLPEYTCNPKLCVVQTLKDYVNRSSLFRVNDSVKQLVLISVKPYSAASNQTVSNWLVQILSESGINTDIYKGHSFRHASTSKAASKGVSTDTIIKRIGWSNATTFARFYRRNIVNETEFAEAVMKSNETLSV